MLEYNLGMSCAQSLKLRLEFASMTIGFFLYSKLANQPMMASTVRHRLLLDSHHGMFQTTIFIIIV